MERHNMKYPQERDANHVTGISQCAPNGAVTNDQALAWIEKGHRCSLPLLELAGQVADPAEVVPRVAESVEGRPYGNFMLTWLNSTETPRVIHYLPDASFFLQLLRLSYKPVFRRRPELGLLLDGTSRLQMSLTNDVLQIQLRGLEANYSMVRHHALMLFHSALWLDDPQRTEWMELYDELASHVFERERGAPSLEELASAETGAFEDFVTLADRTLTVEAARVLLEMPAKLTRILDYLLYAGAAIGLLWREYRDVPEEQREGWHREQITEGYLRADYLERRWVECV